MKYRIPRKKKKLIKKALYCEDCPFHEDLLDDWSTWCKFNKERISGIFNKQCLIK
ncbi:hypothetical protein [Flavicella sediminum]|uniref:hypothetical protein n=1 Tax=Flavicella sediminum TaxID=2585141 RepID=UPI0014073002|nr:hypothetical protein [Flavicella sediminum]